MGGGTRPVGRREALEATLREEKATDEVLSEIAETVVNKETQTQDAA